MACAARGETVLDRLEAIYRRHGLYLTGQRSLALGVGGGGIGARLRAQPPSAIAGKAILMVDDLLTSERRARGKMRPLTLPKSDVLVYRLDGGARVIVRPSGTEPKLKCYYQVREELLEGEPFAAARTRARAAMDALIAGHQAELQAI
jgi:phosphomannomutase